MNDPVTKASTDLDANGGLTPHTSPDYANGKETNLESCHQSRPKPRPQDKAKDVAKDAATDEARVRLYGRSAAEVNQLPKAVVFWPSKLYCV